MSMSSVDFQSDIYVNGFYIFLRNKIYWFQMTFFQRIEKTFKFFIIFLENVLIYD